MTVQTIDQRTAARDKWLANFEMLTQSDSGRPHPHVDRLRKSAIEHFEAKGFPTTRHEEWKYSSVLPLLKKDHQPVFFSGASQVSKEDILDFLIDPQCNRLVFVNGFLSDSLSHISEHFTRLQVGSLAGAIDEHHSYVNGHFGRYAKAEDSAFTALNTAFFRDGAFIHLGAGLALEKPLHILNIVDARAGNRIVNQRNLIILSANTEAKIIQSTHTLGEHHGFTNAVTEVFLEPDARGELYLIQNDAPNSAYIGTTQVHQEEKSTFTNSTVTLRGDFVRNDLNARHGGQHCETHMFGLYLTDGKQHVDNHTRVDHAQPNCYSNEVYKGVLDGESTGVFNGKVIVHVDAQKTNAFQSNKNILLSNGATINTKPQLEIFADDVKCNHGATTGQLDEEALFYLRGRGIPKTLATAILTNAFAADVLESIKVEKVRTQLESLISDRIFGDSAQ